MEGIRAAGQNQQGQTNAKSGQDAGQPMPAMPQTLSPKQGAEAMMEYVANSCQACQLLTKLSRFKVRRQQTCSANRCSLPESCEESSACNQFMTIG